MVLVEIFLVWEGASCSSSKKDFRKLTIAKSPHVRRGDICKWVMCKKKRSFDSYGVLIPNFGIFWRLDLGRDTKQYFGCTKLPSQLHLVHELSPHLPKKSRFWEFWRLRPAVWNFLKTGSCSQQKSASGGRGAAWAKWILEGAGSLKSPYLEAEEQNQWNFYTPMTDDPVCHTWYEGDSLTRNTHGDITAQKITGIGDRGSGTVIAK